MKIITRYLYIKKKKIINIKRNNKKHFKNLFEFLMFQKIYLKEKKFIKFSFNYNLLFIKKNK